jgi:hypothetical protein
MVAMTTARFLFVTGLIFVGAALVPAALGGCGESTTSASVPSASTDGGDAEVSSPPAKAPRFCATGSHDFCADFDGDDPNEGWDQVDPSIDVIETAESDRSPPNALFIHGPGGTKGWGGWLLANLQQTATTIQFGFDVRVDPTTVLDDVNGVTLMSVGAQDPRSSSTHINIASFRLEKSNARLALNSIDPDAGSSGQKEVDLTRPFPLGTWVHLELTLTTGNDGAIAVTLLLDGAAAAEGTLTPGSFTSGDMNFSVGASYRGGPDGPAKEFAGLFDNVTIDLE